MVLAPDAPCAMIRLLDESNNANDSWPPNEPHVLPGPVQLPISDVNWLLLKQLWI